MAYLALGPPFVKADGPLGWGPKTPEDLKLYPGIDE